MVAATLVQSGCCELQKPLFKPTKWRPALTPATLVQSGSYRSHSLLWSKVATVSHSGHISGGCWERQRYTSGPPDRGCTAGGTAAVDAMAAVGGAVGGVLASWNLDCGETLGLKGVESDWPHGILSVMRHCGGGDGCGGNGRCDGDGGAASGAAAGVRGR